MSTYTFIVLSVISLGSFAVLGRQTIAKQLDQWQLLPRPERFTELYFTDYQQLSTLLKTGTTQTLKFTVHNLENRTTRYRYRLVARPRPAAPGRVLASGTLDLSDQHSAVIGRTIAIPSLGARTMLEVDLSYQGIAFGKSAPSLRTQSIDYWVTSAHTERGGA